MFFEHLIETCSKTLLHERYKKSHFDLKFNIKFHIFFPKAKNKHCKPIYIQFIFIPFNAQLSVLSVTHDIDVTFMISRFDPMLLVAAPK